MEENRKEIDEKEARAQREKKPYKSPKLLKLGNVKQMTEGTPDISMPDDTVASQ